MGSAIYDIPVNRIDGQADSLAPYRGQVLLVVNVASKCGLTPQYAELQKLQDEYHAQGFNVLGFPANDFREQEPGTNADIQAFCSTTYGVDFPMYSKIAVTGDNKHPLYQFLTAALPQVPGRDAMETRLRGFKIEPTQPPEVLWNFEKFLINRDGQVAARFAPDTPPNAPQIKSAIEAALTAA